MKAHGLAICPDARESFLHPFRDTLLMLGGETRTIAFVADNPGKGLFQCHVLSHAASGMMTWLEVA